jgi:hypothetical protein
MTPRTLVLPLGLGLTAVLCVPAAASDPAPPGRPAPRVYTNEDLDRVHRLRDQTGVHSVPAAAPETAPPPALDGTGTALVDAHGRGEEYWRREAERVRDRVRALETEADELRLRASERAEEEGRSLGRGGRGPASRGSVAALRARIEALERRMKQMDTDLAERARRARALPGWLR